MIMYRPRLCEFCEEPLRKSKVRHVNIQNDPHVHFFCCKPCRLEWIYEVQANKGRV